MEAIMLYNGDEFAGSTGACLALVLLSYLFVGIELAILIPIVWFTFGISLRLLSRHFERTLPRRRAVKEALEKLNNELMESPD